MLAASCASNSSSPHVASLGATTTTVAADNENSTLPSREQVYQDQVAYAGCMRTHGLPNYPFPQSNPSGRNVALNSSFDSKSKAYPAANRACKHLLPFGGGFPTPAEIAKIDAQLLKFAECMRRNGVPNFPDPIVSSHSIGFKGVNPFSKAARKAQRVCGRPGGGP